MLFSLVYLSLHKSEKHVLILWKSETKRVNGYQARYIQNSAIPTVEGGVKGMYASSLPTHTSAQWLVNNIIFLHVGYGPREHDDPPC